MSGSHRSASYQILPTDGHQQAIKELIDDASDESKQVADD
jgi:hypothetical protein